MAEKLSRTEELIEALMLRMDAMDQAIASFHSILEGAAIFFGGGGRPCAREGGHRRAGVHLVRRSPPASKRVRGQRKGKGAGEKRAEATPPQVGDSVNLPLMQSEVSASQVVGAGQPRSGGLGQVTAQTTSVVVRPENTVAGRDTGASSEGETSQRDLVGAFSVSVAMAV
ncbi:hypothetical protein NDU88_003983 [Pleurodeles waltl]|uniref:Uncharacterized protein n=1 Tax=Pleurodeles waltl TaxID=8319 RepID=A0AAV7W6U0_PLEWA|nr:hypothetical protein NDU88_003983 [Pleurodeles waltl]